MHLNGTFYASKLHLSRHKTIISDCYGLHKLLSLTSNISSPTCTFWLLALPFGLMPAMKHPIRLRSRCPASAKPMLLSVSRCMLARMMEPPSGPYFFFSFTRIYRTLFNNIEHIQYALKWFTISVAVIVFWLVVGSCLFLAPFQVTRWFAINLQSS